MQVTANPKFFTHYQRFNLGHENTLSPECRLSRGNLHWSGTVDLSGEHEIPLFNFLMDLKVQSEKSMGYSCGVNSQKRDTHFTY